MRFSSLYRWGGQFYRWTLDLLLPPQCVVCGKVNRWLCSTCADKIQPLSEPVCPRCGRVWNGEGICPVCQGNSLHVAPIHSAYLFRDEIREVVHALKYRGAWKIVFPLVPSLVAQWQRYAMISDVLLPVPLHPQRKLRRGYNQSEVLARALGAALHLPVLNNVLVRTRNTASQTKLNRTERRSNVLGAFSCKNPEAIQGKTVTLVDDVATTGATLDACAVVLLNQGAASVNAFTLARTV